MKIELDTLEKLSHDSIDAFGRQMTLIWIQLSHDRLNVTLQVQTRKVCYDNQTTHPLYKLT